MSLGFPRLYSYLGGDGPACADVTSSKHLFVAQDAPAGVLLVVQELLERGESVLGVRGAGNLLQQPADLIRIVFHLEKEEDEDMTDSHHILLLYFNLYLTFQNT